MSYSEGRGKPWADRGEERFDDASAIDCAEEHIEAAPHDCKTANLSWLVLFDLLHGFDSEPNG